MLPVRGRQRRRGRRTGAGGTSGRLQSPAGYVRRATFRVAAPAAGHAKVTLPVNRTSRRPCGTCRPGDRSHVRAHAETTYRTPRVTSRHIAAAFRREKVAAPTFANGILTLANSSFLKHLQLHFSRRTPPRVGRVGCATRNAGAATRNAAAVTRSPPAATPAGPRQHVRDAHVSTCAGSHQGNHRACVTCKRWTRTSVNDQPGRSIATRQPPTTPRPEAKNPRVRAAFAPLARHAMPHASSFRRMLR